MKIIHIKITFRDTFSGAYCEKITTRSEHTFERMKACIGQVVTRFENNINWHWEVISVEQCQNPNLYKNELLQN